MEETEKRKIPTIYDLPLHIIERVCQFFLDDQCWPHEVIILGSINDVLNFRATCWRFNEFIMSSSLKFRLSLELSFSLDHILDTGTLSNALALVSSTSWKCSGMQILAGHRVDWQPLYGTIVPILKNFESIFSSKIDNLRVDYVRNFQEYCAITDAVSWLLSPKVKIDLDIYFDWNHNDLPPSLPFSDRLKNLCFGNTYFPHELRSGIMENIFGTFNNLEIIEVLDMRPSIKSKIVLCQNLRQISFGSVNSSDFGFEVLDQFSCKHIQNLSITLLKFDLKHQEKVSFQMMFPNLTSLTIISCCCPKDIYSFDLPPTCLTVKLDTSIFKCVLNCPFIKHLMIDHEVGLEDEINELTAYIHDIKFQLEVFVYRNMYDRTTSNQISVEKFVVPFLESQPLLKLLVIDVDGTRYPRDRNEFERDFLEATNIVEKTGSVLMLHPCLEFFRWRSIFLVLRMSMKPQLFSLIKKLDYDFEWDIATRKQRRDKMQPNLFRISSLTIT